MTGPRVLAPLLAFVAIASCAFGTNHRVVGYTRQTFSGAGSIRAFSAACAEQYGPEARFCNVKDYQRTEDPPRTWSAWVGDVGGRSGLDCRNWSSTAGSARAVGRYGGLYRVHCSGKLPAACCAPTKGNRSSTAPPEPSSSE